MSVLKWLRRLFSTDARSAEAGMPKRYDGPYRIFTTEFDREVDYRTAPSVSAFVLHNPAWPDYNLDACLEEWVPEYEPAAMELVTSLKSANLSDTLVCILVDHSGSLRGEKSCLVAASVGIASECLARLSVRHEILGFTTRTWHGGEARQRWLSVGKPKAPGRLCDLLHIVYREIQEVEPISHDGLRLMANPRILKENVDGEAVQWATHRPMQQPASRRIVIVVSDGAPVDDSTLLFNGPNILDDHLRQVAQQVVAEREIELYGVGIHYAMFRYYPQYVVIKKSRDIGDKFLPVLTAILSSTSHAPRASQVTHAPT